MTARPISLLLLVATALVLAAPAGAGADVLQDLGATFEQVARELATAFPKVDARVEAVAGDEVQLAGPGVGALRPGLELTAYRRGEVFRHPITNQPLGHTEEEVATLVVVAGAGDRATARVAVTEGGRTPVPGDGARLTAGRIPVAVLPPLGVVAAGETSEQTALLLVSRFSALLEKTGRFIAAPPERVLEVAMPGGAPLTPLEAARRLKAPAVLSSRLTPDDGRRHLEVAWVSAQTGATLVTARVPLVRATYPPRFAWETTPEVVRRQPLESPVRGLAVADLDGDGRPEVVVADERAITIYRWREGIGLLQAAGGAIRTAGTVLSLDAADVNGAGRAQIVVVEYAEGVGTHARVLELAGERVRSLYETAGHYLRAVRVGDESWLLEQAVGEREPFDREIRRLIWSDGRYRSGPALRVPKSVSVYGLALMRLTGAAEPEVVALTDDDRLAVWTAGGRRIWTSAEPYGGSAITFPFKPSYDVRENAVLVGRVRGRVVPLPTGAEGPELLVYQNLLPVGSQFRTLVPGLAPLAFTQGRVHRLRWKDGGFVRVWESVVTEGYIADYAYGDIDGDGLPEVVVGVVPRGLDFLGATSRPKGIVVFYELP